MPTFKSFATWSDLLAHIGQHGQGRLWYHAPLDYNPRQVIVTRVYKNGKLRIDPLSSGADNFTADAGHLSRFRTLA